MIYAGNFFKFKITRMGRVYIKIRKKLNENKNKNNNNVPLSPWAPSSKLGLEGVWWCGG